MSFLELKDWFKAKTLSIILQRGQILITSLNRSVWRIILNKLANVIRRTSTCSSTFYDKWSLSSFDWFCRKVILDKRKPFQNSEMKSLKEGSTGALPCFRLFWLSESLLSYNVCFSPSPHKRQILISLLLRGRLPERRRSRFTKKHPFLNLKFCIKKKLSKWAEIHT